MIKVLYLSLKIYNNKIKIFTTQNSTTSRVLIVFFSLFANEFYEFNIFLSFEYQNHSSNKNQNIKKFIIVYSS